MPPAAPEPRRRLDDLVVWGVLAGFLVHALTWAESSLWYDEAMTVLRPAGRPHHVYTGLLGLWAEVAGRSLVALRLLSALLATLAAWTIVHGAGRSGGDRVTAALLACGLPVVFRYAVELRTYALVVAVGALSVRALLAAGERPGARALAAVAASGAAAICVHPALGVTVLAVQHVALALQAGLGSERARRLRAQGVVGAVQAVAVAPVLAEVRGYRATMQAISPDKYPGPSPGRLARVAADLGPGAFGPLPLQVLGGLGLAALVVLGLAALRSRTRRVTAAVLVVGPVAAAAAVTPVQPMFVTRVLLPVAPALVVAAAWALPGAPRVRRASAAALFVLGTGLSASGAWQRQDYGGVVAAVADDARAGDGLLAYPDHAWLTIVANAELGPRRLPEGLRSLGEVDAGTGLRAAGLDYAVWPERSYVVLERLRGLSRPLARELARRFASVEEVGRFRGGVRVLRCEGPLGPDVLLRRSPPAGERPAVTHFRAGWLHLRAGRAEAARRSFQRARESARADPTGDPRLDRDDQRQIEAALRAAGS